MYVLAGKQKYSQR